MQNQRMFAHDYTRVGFYMITILTANRRALFGVCKDDHVHLSPMGKVVKRRWFEIPLHRNAIEVSDLIVMPDHLHAIIYVKEPLLKPVGQVIRGFKSGVTSELRKLSGNPQLEIWEESFHDRVIMNLKTLKAERFYITDNPRRYCLRKAHPDLFSKAVSLKNSRLPLGTHWFGFGNLHLLDKPALMPVQVSRFVKETDLKQLKVDFLKQALRGSVMVSPFISKAEKDVAQMLIQQGYGGLILLKPKGFPPLYKPTRTYFDLCAKGRLLVLSGFAYTSRSQKLTRENCLQMNNWVQEICHMPFS